MRQILLCPDRLAACRQPAARSPPPSRASPAAIAAAATDDAELLARGEYLVRIAGCNDCHTAGLRRERGATSDKAQWLVGSPLGYNGPWGTTYAANLRLKLAEMDEATLARTTAPTCTPGR